MALRLEAIGPIPEETARIAHAPFPKGHQYLRLRDELGTIYDDARFTGLFPVQGRPAHAPWRLALVTVLQFAEGLTDRQAADAVRDRLAWKYLLGLELTDTGFDFSILSDIQAFIQYSRQFTQPIVQTANIANVIQSTIGSAERVFELLDEPEEDRDGPDARELAAPNGEVTFEHVLFRYDQDTPLIEDMNIDVKPGQTIAIVGPTGAGKTTLVNLLMRFYEVGGGRITFDGIDIRDLKRGALRSLFGMVLQDTRLFNGTIRDNIAYGRAGATEEEVIRAARAAQADHFIRTLPEGNDTVLNEEASNISQGQKQLLTIARAFLADPAVLILDEAPSSVDSRTEVLIRKAMTTLMQGRTSFVIAHWLSTIRDAQAILVMDRGRIIEQGSHRDLLARGGFYADLYNSQFAGAHLEETPARAGALAAAR